MKKVILYQSFCGFGRASMTGQLPVLSAMGVQPCPVPTAMLSTHLGYPDPAVTDLTAQCAVTVRHWARLGLRFDGLLTGFLKTPEQAQIALDAAGSLLAEDAVLVVDPVLGDGGRLYASVTPAVSDAVSALAARADVITPNLTEAAVLLGKAPDARPADAAELTHWLAQLSGGRRAVVLTGYRQGDRLGAAVWPAGGPMTAALAPASPAAVHGVGDLFSAILLGGLCRGAQLQAAAARAVSFCAAAVAAFVAAGTPEPEGAPFEPLLSSLCGDAPLAI